MGKKSLRLLALFKTVKDNNPVRFLTFVMLVHRVHTVYKIRHSECDVLDTLTYACNLLDTKQIADEIKEKYPTKPLE